ncbi:hypothetical protein M758_5G150400 [Ceratodon purpureus]|nr:hypothetical protein M758_5G150400 [Ceratodon purpureus]
MHIVMKLSLFLKLCSGFKRAYLQNLFSLPLQPAMCFHSKEPHLLSTLWNVAMCTQV